MGDLPIIGNEQLFLNIAKACIKRPGIDGLLDKLQNSDFFTAPASTKYHACIEGGLCWHSLNVLRALMGTLRLKAQDLGKPIDDFVKMILAGQELTTEDLATVNGVIALVFGYRITLESLVIVTLFHDLHKLGHYEQYEKSVYMGLDQWGNKVWDKQTLYKTKDDCFVFGDNGSNSNYIIMTYIKLTYEEAASIQNHDGYTPDHHTLYSADKVWSKIPLALYLHLADMESCYVTERG